MGEGGTSANVHTGRVGKKSLMGKRRNKLPFIGKLSKATRGDEKKAIKVLAKDEWKVDQAKKFRMLREIVSYTLKTFSTLQNLQDPRTSEADQSKRRRRQDLTNGLKGKMKKNVKTERRRLPVKSNDVLLKTSQKDLRDSNTTKKRIMRRQEGIGVARTPQV